MDRELNQNFKVDYVKKWPGFAILFQKIFEEDVTVQGKSYTLSRPDRVIIKPANCDPNFSFCGQHAKNWA